MMETAIDTEEPGKDSKAEAETTKFNRIKDVVNTLKPALICEHVYGIFRFRFEDNKLLPPRGRTMFLAFIVVTIYVVSYAFTLKFPAAIKQNRALVEIIDEVPSLIILLQYIASVLITMFCNSEKTIKVITLFSELDCNLRISMNENFYKKSRCGTIKYILLSMIFHLFFSTIDMLTSKDVTLDNVFTTEVLPLVLYMEQDLEIFVFCKMVYMLTDRLRIINDYLAKFIEEQETVISVFTVNKKDYSEHTYNFIGRPSDSNHKIKDLARTYDVIGETCTMINEIFNFQIFMNLVSTFSYIIITIWASLYYYRNPANVDSQLYAVVLWCVLTVLSVGVMAFSCEQLLTARHHTRILVNEIIMNYDLPRGMRVQAKVFMEMIEAWPLQIFVYDMFSVDITLMLKFVSVATTYLIVVIQVSHLL